MPRSAAPEEDDIAQMEKKEMALTLTSFTENTEPNGTLRPPPPPDSRVPSHPTPHTGQPPMSPHLVSFSVVAKMR